MFRLVEQGRQVLSLAVAKDLIERLAQLYGVGKARAMRRVDYEAGPFKVKGYAALPSITESSRSSQTISVNGRWVRAEGLTKGIDDAYRGTVPAGRYPPVALRVEVDPRQVDVNVHPTKQLVRFSDERGVRQALSKAISHAIQGTGDSVPEQDARNTESAEHRIRNYGHLLTSDQRGRHRYASGCTRASSCGGSTGQRGDLSHTSRQKVG